jgi:hypothetical protein
MTRWEPNHPRAFPAVRNSSGSRTPPPFRLPETLHSSLTYQKLAAPYQKLELQDNQVFSISWYSCQMNLNRYSESVSYCCHETHVSDVKLLYVLVSMLYNSFCSKADGIQ